MNVLRTSKAESDSGNTRPLVQPWFLIPNYAVNLKGPHC